MRHSKARILTRKGGIMGGKYTLMGGKYTLQEALIMGNASMYHCGWSLHSPLMPRMRIHNELKGVDVESEYKLIMQKKSKLSARLRREVIRKYERMNKEEKQ
jgi:hypothetical protein